MVERMVFYPERMMRNLELTHGLVYSQQILLELARKGLPRQEAYVLVQRNAMKTFSGAGSFADNLCADAELLQKMSIDEIKECFSLSKHLKHVDIIFQRVFGG